MSLSVEVEGYIVHDQRAVLMFWLRGDGVRVSLIDLDKLLGEDEDDGREV